VDMIMRPASEPRVDLGCLVGGVIVHDDMDVEPFRDVSVDFFEELQERDRPVPPPNREQIRVNTMSACNLDNTGRRRQTLLDDPKLLGSGPPASPLRTG
jgi:hypothetical protein